jgi:hypothetical protein
MIIEFCGVPGGGKSSLFRSYTNTYRNSVVALSLSMYNRFPTVWYAGIFMLLHPRSFVALALYVRRTSARGLRRYSFHLLLRACAKWQKARFVTASKEVHIDEGLMHVIAVLPSHAVSKEEMLRLLKTVPHPDVVCMTNEGVFHRFHNKEAQKHPRVQQGSESLALWEKAVQMNVATLQACLEEIRIPTFIIPGVSASPQTLHAFLKAL